MNVRLLLNDLQNSHDPCTVTVILTAQPYSGGMTWYKQHSGCQENSDPENLDLNLQTPKT